MLIQLSADWLTYREVCQDPAAVLRKISGILGAESEAIAAFANVRWLKEQRMHFVEGDDLAWQREVSATTREALWQACTPTIRALLDLNW